MFYVMDPDIVYYIAFGYTDDTNDNVLPYGEEIQD